MDFLADLKIRSSLPCSGAHQRCGRGGASPKELEFHRNRTHGKSRNDKGRRAFRIPSTAERCLHLVTSLFLLKGVRQLLRMASGEEPDTSFGPLLLLVSTGGIWYGGTVTSQNFSWKMTLIALPRVHMTFPIILLALYFLLASCFYRTRTRWEFRSR